MRRAAALILVLCVAGPAAAEAPVTAWPRWAPEVGFGAHVSQIGARSEGGVDGVVALAYGTGRLQLFGEATLGTAGFDNTATTPALETSIDGSRVWLGGGARWLARQFVIDRELLVEMALHAQSGVERYAFSDGSKLVRPDVAIGAGVDIRTPKIHDLTTRIEVRVVFTPNDTTSIACRGTCDERAGTRPGLAMGITFAW